jgi:hypothetical protein
MSEKKEIEKLILRFKCITPRIASAILKKQDSVEGLTL